MTLELADARPVVLAYQRRLAGKLRIYFPDCQPGCVTGSRNPADHRALCRVLYGPHVQFFALGADYRERLFLKANRAGGTQAAAFEVACHLTGLYPHWWTGRRFETAGDWWAAGETSTTTRNISQRELYGPVSAPRTGFIPGHLILDKSMKSGVTDAIDTIWVRHASGGQSTIQLKSYAEGREGFQGQAIQGAWLDEEPEEGIPEEVLLRTMTTGGIILYTFTPLKGLTPFVASFLESCEMVNPAGLVLPAKSEFWKQAQVEAA